MLRNTGYWRTLLVSVLQHAVNYPLKFPISFISNPICNNYQFLTAVCMFV